MFIVLAATIFLSSFIVILAGSLSLIRSPGKSVNRWFFWLTLVLAVWVPVNFLDSNSLNPRITPSLVKIDFALALLIAWSFLHFVVALINSIDQKIAKRYFKAITNKYFLPITAFMNVGMAACILNGFVATAVVEDGIVKLTNNILFIPYTIFILGYFFYAITILGTAYKKLPNAKRGGLDLIWLGFSFAFIANICSNLIFPNVINDHQTVQNLNVVGYFGIFLLVGCLYTAMKSRRLFNIRLVAARSLVYLLLLAVIALVYAGITTIVGIFLTGAHVDTSVIIINTILIFIASITFQYVKNYFTIATKKLFYRDGYDAQQVLDELNSIITSNLNLKNLADGSIELLVETMKSNFCYFVLPLSDKTRRVYASERTPKQVNSVSKLVEAKLRPHIPLHVESIDDSNLNADLTHLNVELIMPLYTSNTYIGYLAFGTKDNGISYGSQDVRLLGIASDTLAVALQNALRFEEINNFNLTLQEKIDDATKQLRKANEKLKTLDETKDDFISMASHQLRTPLTSVKGYISMVLEEDAGKINKVQHDMLGQAFASSQRMVYLIADLLNVSRLKTGKFIIERVPVDLAEIVQQEMAQLQETAASRSLTVDYIKPDNFPKMLLDETKTRQIIMNFVDNAIYYTPAGGHIDVKLIDGSTTIELRVEDNGIGVPKIEQPHLFTKFYRAGNARKARPDGTGLGLFMAKKVIVAQGGTLLFESKEGKGSTFGFIFSKSKYAAPDVAPNKK
ncbi:MAG: ATP-binding protein [Patescibacteria group bacterium]|nr:ATP-binding protein [Patescibacteria group bacterium]